jgi:hypothetical protein
MKHLLEILPAPERMPIRTYKPVVFLRQPPKRLEKATDSSGVGFFRFFGETFLRA